MNFELQKDLHDIIEMKEMAQEVEKAGKVPPAPSKSFEAMERMIRCSHGDYSMGKVTVQEAITTTDTMKLVPKVIEGKLREASEPEYLGTKFFQKVKVDGGPSAVYVIPVVGELVAYEVGEATKYQESSFDQTTIENATLEIRVRKVGVKVSITEEALSDSSWDILNLNLRKMGRAMARYKEEMIFTNFSQHGKTIFDNDLRDVMPEAGTTGLGKDGNYNDTLSVEDFLELAMSLMGQGYQPTDIIMHPLCWVVFARNGMIGNGLTYGALGGNSVHPNGAIQGTPAAFGMANNGDGQKFLLKPEDIQGRIPVMGLNVNFSPWVKFNKLDKKFDMYCLDKNEVGCIAQREELTTDEWLDVERDIKMIKCKERYGIGIYNHGAGITVAKNLSVSTSYPAQPVINVRTSPTGQGYPTIPEN